MAIYTEEEIELLTERWQGHEEEIKVLIPLLKNDDWAKTEIYKNLMKGMGPLPAGMEKERDLRGAPLEGAPLEGARLEGTHLEGARLEGARLEGAYLQRAYLERAYLQKAYLRGAQLQGAYLQRAYMLSAYVQRSHLQRAHLQGVHLEGAYLQRARLEEASLQKAHLQKAHLQGARLDGAYLQETRLEGARLDGASLQRAHLEEAYLEGADLEGVDLRGARLEGADLRGAYLEEAHLEEAHLERANLQGAHLEGADLLGAHLEGVDLTGVVYTSDEFINRLARSWFPSVKKMTPKKATNFQGVDTTKVDGSRNPVLMRHILDYQFIRAFKNKSELHKWLFYPIWKITCDCGRSLSLWALWSVGLVVFFGFLYAPFSCPSWLPGTIQNLFNQADPQLYISPNIFNHFIATPLYFSIVTFSTLGFGDVHPQNFAGLFWVVLEVILGYVMLGGLISIFATKLARRA